MYVYKACFTRFVYMLVSLSPDRGSDNSTEYIGSYLVGSSTLRETNGFPSHLNTMNKQQTNTNTYPNASILLAMPSITSNYQTALEKCIICSLNGK